MVKLLKLITGEEVIASVSKDEKMTHLKNPARIAIMNDGVRLLPFSLFSKGDSISLKNEHVMFETEVEDELLNGYNSQFGTGIVVPPGAGSIIV